MNIDIYSKYKVRFLNSGAYISQEDSTPDDIVFTHYEDDKEEIIDGGKLLDIIKYKLDDRYLSYYIVFVQKCIPYNFIQKSLGATLAHYATYGATIPCANLLYSKA